MDVRTCPICKQSKPLNAEHFHRQTANHSGFTSYCKPCQSEYIKKRRDSKGETVFERLTHTNTHRICRSCGQETPNEQMRAKNNKYWHSNCKSCRSVKRNKYGITPDDYKAMLDDQNGVCWICKKFDNKALSVDHDHETAKVRGLLCRKCNRALGLFEDDAERLKNAVLYLTER